MAVQTDEQTLHANTHAQDKSLWHSLEHVARSIDLCVDTDKTEFKEEISPL